MKVVTLLQCGAAITFFSSPLLAQEDEVLSEIVVTASKRSEFLRDVPQSISALTDTALQNRGVTDITALGRQTPGLVMSERADKTPNVVMRGVGAFGNVQGVGFYIDDVQNFTDQTMRLQDLQRVEVLKGPQGTLYGGSSIGGAVRYITREPTFDTHANALIESGGNGYRNVYGAVNAQLVEGQVAGRLSGYYTHDDGFMRSPTIADLATSEEYSVRGQLLVRPTERLSGLLSLRYRNFEGGALLANAHDSVDDVSYVADLSVPPEVRSETFGAAAKISYDFEAATLDWIPSYTRQDKEIFSDADYTTTLPQQTVIFSVDPRPTEVVTQEFRLSSKESGKLDWIVGLYGAQLDNVQVAPTPVTAVVTIPAANRVVTRPNFYDYDVSQRDLAAFASTDLHLGDLTLTTGLRLYDVEYDANVFTARSVVLNRKFSQDDTVLLPRLAAAFKTADGQNIYASVARGYEPGKVAISSPTIAPYDPEETWAFEVGSKGYLGETRSLYYEVAGFYSLYDARQFETRILVDNLPTETIGNIGDSTAYGAEGSLNWTVIDDLVTNLSIGYLHSEWDEGAQYNGIDIGGKTPPNSPRWTGNAGITYSSALSSGMKVELHADTSYTDNYQWKLGYDPFSSVNPELWIASAYVAFAHPDDRWRIAVRVTNLFDEASFTDFTPQLFGVQGADGSCDKCHLGYVADRRRVVVSLSTKF